MKTYLQRIDYLLASDDGEETFHKRLKEDLVNIESKKRKKKMEDNKKIALFMGKEIDESKEVLIYHNSWDWLMPVIEKICSIWNDTFTVSVDLEADNTCIITIHFHQPDPTKQKKCKQFSERKGNKIENAYNVIIRFLDWLEIQNKEKLKDDK